MPWKIWKIPTSVCSSQRRAHSSLGSHTAMIFCLCHYYISKHCSSRTLSTGLYLVSQLFATVAAELQKATVTTPLPIWQARWQPPKPDVARNLQLLVNTTKQEKFISTSPKTISQKFHDPYWYYMALPVHAIWFSLISCNLEYPLQGKARRKKVIFILGIWILFLSIPFLTRKGS